MERFVNEMELSKELEMKKQDILCQMKKLIGELEDVSKGIKRDFQGIGNEYCSQAIDRVKNHVAECRKKVEKGL